MALASFLLITTYGYAAEISGVPFVKQGHRMCGPAALSSVFMFYGSPIAQDAVAKAVYSDKLKGTLISDLENYALSKHFKTILGQGTVGQLKRFIDEGKPVIIAVDMGFWLVSQPHYLLVFGYTESGFVAHNGDESYKLYHYSTFQRQWDKTGCAFLVVYP